MRRATQKERLREFAFSMFPRHVLGDHGEPEHRRFNPAIVAQMVDSSQALLTKNEALFPPREAPEPGKMKDRLVQIQQYARLQEKRHTPTKTDTALENVDEAEGSDISGGRLGGRVSVVDQDFAASMMAKSTILVSDRVTDGRMLLKELSELASAPPAVGAGVQRGGPPGIKSNAADVMTSAQSGGKRRSTVAFVASGKRGSLATIACQEEKKRDIPAARVTTPAGTSSSILLIPPKKREVVIAPLPDAAKVLQDGTLSLSSMMPSSSAQIGKEAAISDASTTISGMMELVVDVSRQSNLGRRGRATGDGGNFFVADDVDETVDDDVMKAKCGNLDDVGGRDKLALLAALERANQRTGSAAAARGPENSGVNPKTLVCSVSQIKRVIEHEDTVRRIATANERLGNYSFVDSTGLAIHVDEFPEPREFSSRTCIINSRPEIDLTDMVANIVAKLNPPSIPVVCEPMPGAGHAHHASSRPVSPALEPSGRTSIRSPMIRRDIAPLTGSHQPQIRRNMRPSTTVDAVGLQQLQDRWRMFNSVSPDLRVCVALPSVVRTSAMSLTRHESTPSRFRNMSPARTMLGRQH